MFCFLTILKRKSLFSARLVNLTEKGFPTMIQNLLNGGKHSVKFIAGGVLPLLVKDDLSMSVF